jgi:outer membrane protein assembly factor BamE (lipoprotein component of BamABCDE complex)
MATSGSRPSSMSTFTEIAVSCGRRLALAGVAVLALLGCTPPPPLSDGSLVDTDRLAELKPGVSTADTVRTTLGPPRGHGMARLKSETGLDTVWYYEFVQLKDKQRQLKLLVVFFKDEIYDGHLWFASQLLFKRGPQ